MIRPLAVAFFLASLLPRCLYGAAAAESTPTNAISIGQLRQEIYSHQEKVEQSSLEEHSLLDELASLDQKMKVQKAKIDEIGARIREQAQIITAKERDLALISSKNEALRDHLIKRLRSFYLLGRTGFLNTVFSNKTLPDLLLANDAFHSLVTYDQELFTEYRQSVVAIDRAKRAHELEQSVQEHFLDDAAKENVLLQQVAEQKNAVLQRIQTEKGLYQQAIKEMKKAESELLSTLTKTNHGTEQKSRGFAADKKKLPPPVWGKVISRFHDPALTDENSPFANGITVQTPNRTEVLAVYGGVVIFAGYMSGYGKVVIIEHDQQYYTITARFDEINVQEGDTLKQGQVIGITGDIATLFGQGLYFEIRHGVQPENPLDWIQPGPLASR